MSNIKCKMSNEKCQLSNVKWKIRNVDRVKYFVGAYLRSFSGHFYPSKLWSLIGSLVDLTENSPLVIPTSTPEVSSAFDFDVQTLYNSGLLNIATATDEGHSGRAEDKRWLAQYTIQNTQHTIHNKQYTTNNTQYTIHNTQYTKHNTQNTIHKTQYTIHYTQYTIHKEKNKSQSFYSGLKKFSSIICSLLQLISKAKRELELVIFFRVAKRIEMHILTVEMEKAVYWHPSWV